MSRRRLDAALQRLIAAFANEGLKLEATITAYPKTRKPRGWRLMQPDWAYSECPTCKATRRTFYTSENENERPYTHYQYLCGNCATRWTQTKIWD